MGEYQDDLEKQAKDATDVLKGQLDPNASNYNTGYSAEVSAMLDRLDANTKDTSIIGLQARYQQYLIEQSGSIFPQDWGDYYLTDSIVGTLAVGNIGSAVYQRKDETQEEYSARLEQLQQFGLPAGTNISSNTSTPSASGTNSGTTGGTTYTPPATTVTGTATSIANDPNNDFTFSDLAAIATAKGVDPNAAYLWQLDGQDALDAKVQDAIDYLKKIDSAGVGNDKDGYKPGQVAPKGMPDEVAANLGLIPRSEVMDYVANLASITPPDWSWVYVDEGYGEVPRLKSPSGAIMTLDEAANDPIFGNYIRAGLGITISTESGWIVLPDFQFESPEGIVWSLPELVDLGNMTIEERVEAVGVKADAIFWTEVQEVLETVFPTEKIMAIYASLRFDDEDMTTFVSEMQKIGRTKETESLVKYLFPEIDESGMAYLFNEAYISLDEWVKSAYNTSNMPWEKDYKEGDVIPQDIKDKYNKWLENVNNQSDFMRWFNTSIGNLFSQTAGFFFGINKKSNEKDGETGDQYLLETIADKLNNLSTPFLVQSVMDTDPEHFTGMDIFRGVIENSLPILTMLGIGALTFGGAGGLVGGTAIGLSPFKSALLRTMFGTKAGMLSYVGGSIGGNAGMSFYESAIEASNVYDSIMLKLLDDTSLTDIEKDLMATEGFNTVFDGNMKALLGTNFLEMLIAFFPAGKAASKTIKGLTVSEAAVKRGFLSITPKGLAQAGGALTAVTITEVGQEIYQEYLTRKALGEPFELDDEMKLTIAIAAIYAGGFTTVGKVYTTFQDKVINNLTPESQAIVNQAAEEAIANGEDPDVAKLKALDGIAETNPEEASNALEITMTELSIEQTEELISGDTVNIDPLADKAQAQALVDGDVVQETSIKEQWQIPFEGYDQQFNDKLKTLNDTMAKLQEESNNIVWTTDKHGYAIQKTKVTKQEQERYLELIKRQKLVDSERNELLASVNEKQLEHETIVEKALTEGKPVPANVLRQYPHLEYQQKTKPKLSPAKKAIIEHKLNKDKQALETRKAEIKGGEEPTSKESLKVEDTKVEEEPRPKGAGPGTPRSNFLIDGEPLPIDRIITQSKEVVKQDLPGYLTRWARHIPGLKQLIELERPGVKMEGESEPILVALVGQSAAKSDVLTKTGMSKPQIIKEAERVFGKEALHGGQATVKYIGAESQRVVDVVIKGGLFGRKKVVHNLTGTIKDIMDNPQLYDLTQEQKNFLAEFEARNTGLLYYVRDGYGVEIGEWQAKEDGAYLATVDVSEDAIEVAGSQQKAISRGRGKTRRWPSARDRMGSDKTFVPELDFVKLLNSMDASKVNGAGNETFLKALGGKTRLEVIKETDPDLYNRMMGFRKQLKKLQGYKNILKEEQAAIIEDFENGRFEDEDMSALRDALDVKLEAGRYVAKAQAGKTLADIQAEIDAVKEELTKLRPDWKSANPKPYVLVQNSIFRYFKAEQAHLIIEALETTNNHILNFFENVRGTAFSGDLSPILGVQTPMGALFGGLWSAGFAKGAFVRAMQEGDILRSFRIDKLAEDIQANHAKWARYFSLTGHAAAGIPSDYAGGFLAKIPGFSSFTESTYVMVTRQSFLMWEKLTAIAMKSGASELEAEVIAAEKVTEVFPLMSPAKLGQSQRRNAFFRAMPTSYSFIRQPMKLMANSTTAVGKILAGQKLSAKEQLSLRLMLQLTANLMIVSVLSAVLDALRRGDDPIKAALDAINPDPYNGKFLSFIINDELRIPLATPYRALFKAIFPQEVSGVPVPVPFVGLINYFGNRLNPVISTGLDIFHNEDYFHRKVYDITKDATDLENALRIIEYGLEAVLPLSLGQIVEDIRTGEADHLIRNFLSQFAGFNLIEMGKAEDTDELVSKLGIDVPNTSLDDLTIKPDKVYDTGNLWSDLTSKLQWVKPEDITLNKGYSPIVVAWNEARTINNTVSSYSDTQLYKINADSSKGDTFVEYYKKWQEVERINGLDKGDYDKWVEAHGGKKPEDVYTGYNLGNMTQAEYADLVKYHSLTTASQKEAWLKSHPNLSANKQAQYLIDNPAENAKLAIWGKADIESVEAYNEAVKLVEELGLPWNAVSIAPPSISKGFTAYIEAENKYTGTSFASTSAAEKLRIQYPEFDAWKNYIGDWSVTKSTKASNYLIQMREGTFDWETLNVNK